MADVVTLGDVSTKDTGSGSTLKTGGRRKHNMPKECVKQKMKAGMSKKEAVDACYPKAGKMLKTGIRYGLLKMKEKPKKPTKQTTKRRKGGKLGRDY